MANLIKNIRPKTTNDGDVIRKITTSTQDQGQRGGTRTKYYHRIKEADGRVTFLGRLSAARPTLIRKPLYEVEDMNGEVHTMTKRQAKKYFSARQVRKALKQMRVLHKHQHKKVLEELRRSRGLSASELDDMEQEFDATTDQELSDEELLGLSEDVDTLDVENGDNDNEDSSREEDQ